MIINLKNTTKQPMRIKAFLKSKGLSHRLISTAKHEGTMKIDGHKVSTTDVLDAGAELNLRLPKEKSDANVPFSFKPVEIVFEDDNWLVINKPVGLSSVPGPSNREDTVVNRVKGHLKDQGSKDLIPHVITRLDRDTSGVMLIAKNRLAVGVLAPQIENHDIEKKYFAFVQGTLKEKEGLIDKPIARAEDGIHREVSETGQQAQTRFQLIQQYDTYALVEVELLTGRTHQIRVHFASLGHPLLGDQLYGGPMDKKIVRQALHATSLKFVDPLTDQTHLFEVPMPQDMENLKNV
ncbi:RluA family pseudouridine synthase [Pediococcus ethanolidurans]|uniref:Pseudouridine synthase n=1 Tax=Pediococcus ethanolidurans TaxID=319653 RepID=A0A0R2K694_9LACO|nr:RluA family pseudouridine synthase [Pediococcus ethanolidurans]KRN83366.1 RluA family pseudouridine synthase [Pediococcus ethanolidurans]GEN95847.1 pseudouridine synthase [Pediococcus ethanolidurans]SER21929.1 23S rRNA pseudouridine1911/1915/1917 synthase [Pediococcus ethanolidurans]